MEYFYKYRCENARPDFAALAVLEKQSCPQGSDSAWWYQTCTSRYRIISVLNAASDTLRKEYLEAENYPIMPYFLYRPILFFGNYKNGKIRIEEFEETREYFYPFDISVEVQQQDFMGLIPLVADLASIYALHSMGTPYYPKNLDTRDSVFYNRYLIPRIKQYMGHAGKDFNKFWQRLTKERTPVKTAKVKNGFAALGAIVSIHPASDAKLSRFYELNVAIETIFENDANIDSSISIYIDKERLPPTWGCLYSGSLHNAPFYLFGDIKNGHLIIESWGSTRDMFVYGDTIYDITMGLSFRELLTFFLPANISFEEFEFGNYWQNIVSFTKIKNDKMSNYMNSMPACRRKAIIEIAEKWIGFFNSERMEIGGLFAPSIFLDIYRPPSTAPYISEFRCRKDPVILNGPPMFGTEYKSRSGNLVEEKPCDRCHRQLSIVRLGRWGRKLPYITEMELIK